MEARPLGRVVHEDVAAENDAGAGAAHAEARAFPECRARLVDDTGRVEHVADPQPAQRAGEPERHETPLGHPVRDTDADAHCIEPEPPRDALLGARRASEGVGAQPVSVHARLRTVSFRLLDASYAADGSKPQWIPQCSHRGSLPGPYASHSMPSSSASYVGKIPSVRR